MNQIKETKNKMSGFDPEERESSRSNREMTKYPIKRLELSIKKFIKVLDIDLDRLQKHTVCITKFINAEDWSNLHREQVNASRTIQQIQANIREIEKARNQVINDELPEFDAKVEGVKVKAIESMKEFMMFAGNKTDHSVDSSSIDTGPSPSSIYLTNPESKVLDLTRQLDIADCPEEEAGSQSMYGSLPAVIHTPFIETLNLHVAPQNSEASVSWEELQENILELNALVHEFSARIEVQKEKVTSIEENIDHSQDNIKEGTHQLAKAARYKSALLPVVGAMVGGVVAGPVGLVAGMKIGGLAGAFGGAVGFAGGRLVKRHQEKISAMELENMSDKRSLSLPELPEQDRRQVRTLVNSPELIEQATDTQAPVAEKNDDVFASVTSSFRRFFSLSDE